MFFYVGENTGDGELDLSGIDDSEIDRVRSAFIPSLSAFGYLRKKERFLSGVFSPSLPLHSGSACL